MNTLVYFGIAMYLFFTVRVRYDKKKDVYNIITLNQHVLIQHLLDVDLSTRLVIFAKQITQSIH